MEKYSYIAMTEEDEDIISALKTTASNHNWSYAYKALYQYVRYNHVGGFSRDNNARANMTSIGIDKLNKTIARRLNQDELDSISLEQGVFDYITYAYHNDRDLANKINSFEFVCQETITRYTNDYSNDEAVYQLTGAIRKASLNNDYSSFTNKPNKSRDGLIAAGINPQDLEFFMRISLNGRRHENPDYAYDKLANLGYEEILSMYVNQKNQDLTQQYSNTNFHK